MEYVNELDTISARAAQKDAALKVHRLTFMEATMMVVGSTIGSGVLGLAFASRNAGWPVLLTWLVVAGFFSIISMLYVAEATLRTTKPLQLSGLAEKYVGKIGSCSRRQRFTGKVFLRDTRVSASTTSLPMRYTVHCR